MASIKPAGNGVWKVQICDGYDERGKKNRIRKTIHVDPRKTELAQIREVERIVAQLEADYTRHVVTDAKRIRFSALCEEFYESCKRKGLADSTINGYKFLFDKRIIPAFGSKFVQDITPRMITTFYIDLATRKTDSVRCKKDVLSGTTQLHYHRALHILFNYAVRMQYITVNPVDAVEPPRKDTKETLFYELSDCAKLLDALDSLPDEQWRLFFYLSIYTGMRPGEIIGLDWDDIDLKNHVLTVRAGCAYVKGVGTIRTDRPKTQKSIRVIDLPDNIVWMLTAHRKQQDEYKKSFGDSWPEPAAVFTGDLGKRLDKSSPTQKFQKIIKAYNLRPITLYGLRHTAATIMIAQGLSARDVAARLGHAQTSTTLNIYAHAFADASSRATNAIVSALDDARKKPVG